jgi:sortase family protein
VRAGLLRGWWPAALAVAGGTALVAGLVALPPGPQRSAPEPPAVTAAAPAPVTAAALGPSEPVRLRIPAIGVDAALLRLGLRADGRVEVPPPDSPAAGWYRYSPSPGEPGPAVLLGHVDSARTGPGVFYDLPALAAGDPIEVARADGSTVRFVVERVGRYPKAAFPTAEVYGDRPGAELRLITCGGAFDGASGHYLDNVVVFAAARAEPPG